MAAEPSARGLDGAVAWLIEPLPGRSIVAGPRLGAFWAPSAAHGARFDVNTGVEAVAWVANAAGPGAAVDFVAPSREGGRDRGARVRAESFVGVRFLRQGESGAWNGRLGVVYDVSYKWAFKLGIALQFSGVNRIGEE
jgi:hypothetical protein